MAVYQAFWVAHFGRKRVAHFRALLDIDRATCAERGFAAANPRAGKRRKTLRNALSALFNDPDRASAILRRTGIHTSTRAETLGLEQWMALAQETVRTLRAIRESS